VDAREAAAGSERTNGGNGGEERERERGQKKRPLRGTGSVPWITGNNHPY